MNNNALLLEKYIKKYLSKESDSYIGTEKKEIIEDLTRCKRVIAGAGTGKTFLLKHLIVYSILSENAGLNEICAVSFNKDIALVLKEQTKKLYEEFYGAETHEKFEMNISTFHSLALKQSKYKNWEENRLALITDDETTEDGFESIKKINFEDYFWKVLLKEAGYTELELIRDFDLVFEDVLKKMFKKINNETINLIASGEIRIKDVIQELLKNERDDKVELESLLSWIVHVELIFVSEFKLTMGLIQQSCCSISEIKTTLKQHLVKNSNSELNTLLGRKGGNSIEEKQIEKIVELIQVTYSTKEKYKLFDYSDMLVDCRNKLKDKESKNNCPKYKYFLVDEFQDVNKLHVDIIELFTNSRSNVVVVGDPRQCIYGWNGSNKNYILNFNSIFEDAKSFSLKTSFRCPKKIVIASNEFMGDKGYPSLDSVIPDADLNKLPVLGFDDNLLELRFVSKLIIEKLLLENKYSPSDILVLSRTNSRLGSLKKILNEVIKENLLNLEKCGLGKLSPHFIKSDRAVSKNELFGEKLFLMSIHSAKGLEAKVVFILDCSDKSMPNQASSSRWASDIRRTLLPFFDKDGEEENLFYVAMTRAKEMLIITYPFGMDKRGNYSGVSEFVEKIANHFEIEKVEGVLPDSISTLVNKFANKFIPFQKYPSKEIKNIKIIEELPEEDPNYFKKLYDKVFNIIEPNHSKKRKLDDYDIFHKSDSFGYVKKKKSKPNHDYHYVGSLDSFGIRHTNLSQTSWIDISELFSLKFNQKINQYQLILTKINKSEFENVIDLKKYLNDEKDLLIAKFKVKYSFSRIEEADFQGKLEPIEELLCEILKIEKCNKVDMSKSLKEIIQIIENKLVDLKKLVSKTEFS